MKRLTVPRLSAFLAPFVAAGALLGAGASAQFLEQRYVLTGDERRELELGRDRLQRLLRPLREDPDPSRTERLPDVEIYLDGLDRCLRQSLFFNRRDVESARLLLREGEERARSLAAGRAPWEAQTGDVVLGHRSEVDGSAQPYHLYVPPGYRRDGTGKERLDLFLHGRGGTLSEINFIAGGAWLASSWGGAKPAGLALYPYGRANNGWRFAGEQDMWEALADVRRRFRIDDERITLRGFSMGGHGTWHVGLQHPGKWAVMSPGAGFTDTLNYQKITAPMPDWQRRLLRLYDPVDYAANAANLPVLAYCGEQDPALDQHQQMVAAMRREGAPFKEYLGPNTPHRYEPAALTAILEEMGKHTRRAESPELRFVTYSLRWPECKWARIEGLERHWERAEITAAPTASGSPLLTTRNISALTLTPPASATGNGSPRIPVSIDGQRVAQGTPGRAIRLVRRGGRWRTGELKGLRKRPGLQGPIDDALFGPVLAVRGTGVPWSASAGRWSDLELLRFREGWDEYFRARLPEVTDTALTEAEVRRSNLYLFGDPGSNAVLRRILDRLPLDWGRGSFTLAGKRYSTQDHLPVLVFPNPENPDRYVVLNSGFTFSRADWNGSNARQYPHLPDYAVLRIDPDRFMDQRGDDVRLAGFFDERWRLSE